MGKNLTLSDYVAANTSEIDKLRVKKNENVLRVSYISDMHLETSCKYFFRKLKVINKIIPKFNAHYSVILIAGDTANDPELFKLFFGQLKNRLPIFVTLGNHELFNFSNKPIDEIVKIYKETLNENQFLVHNNLFLFTPCGISEISFIELKKISITELKLKAKAAYLVIFGGIGFSGKNFEFNANNKIYGKNSYIDREEEIKLTNEFYSLYKKVSIALKNKKVIVLTHMPVECWYNNINDLVDGFIYVNGHTHRNKVYTNKKWIVYADNQIGNPAPHGWFFRKASFWSRRIELKHFNLNEQILDCFSGYDDGIYEITKDQYNIYNAYLSTKHNYIRYDIYFIFFYSKLKLKYSKIYMVKKNKYYMFFALNQKNKLLIFDGGLVKRADNQDLQYYYQNIDLYATSARAIFSKYNTQLEEISQHVKKWGGKGRIHGSIVDIGFLTHLYVNPIDGKITPYFANAINDKYVFSDLGKMLKECEPYVYLHYKNELNSQLGLKNLVLFKDIIKKKNNIVHDISTDIYKISNYIYKLQKTNLDYVVRIWDEKILRSNSILDITNTKNNFLIEEENDEDN